jgi:hypothetical protein
VPGPRYANPQGFIEVTPENQNTPVSEHFRLRDFLTNVIVEPVGDLLDQPDGPYRVSLVGSQIVGLGVARYVVGLEPLASASVDDLVAAVAPTLQRYLTGDL